MGKQSKDQEKLLSTQKDYPERNLDMQESLQIESQQKKERPKQQKQQVQEQDLSEQNKNCEGAACGIFAIFSTIICVFYYVYEDL